MNAQVMAFWIRIQSSYWFIPAVMSVFAILGSTLSIQLDQIVSDKWIGEIDFLYANEPEGARLLLSTIAGSMIGVAGITFSITIAAVAFASGQFGPRILTNFMRDRVNQITLGVFVSTFLYCLLVLRTIQSNVDSSFIPHFSVLIGVLLALASIGVLINFIHHIAASIHVSTAMSRVGAELIHSVDTMFPQQIGHSNPENKLSKAEADELEQRLCSDQATRVASQTTGYVQALADEKLLETASANDLIIRLTRQPGDFTAPGRTLMWVWPAVRADDEVKEALNKSIAVGLQRTPDQDIRFLVEQLTDMAGRALSPGINDPYTAASCINWLGAAIGRMAAREAASPYRYDGDANLRVVASIISFEDICAQTFGSLRQYVETSLVAAERMMSTIYDVLLDTTDPARREVLVDYADQLMLGVEQSLPHPADVERVRQCRLMIEAVMESETTVETESLIAS